MARPGKREEGMNAHQKQHHVPYSLAISINGTFLLIHGIASTLWAFQYVFLIIFTFDISYFLSSSHVRLRQSHI